MLTAKHGIKTEETDFELNIWTPKWYTQPYQLLHDAFAERTESGIQKSATTRGCQNYFGSRSPILLLEINDTVT